MSGGSGNGGPGKGDGGRTMVGGKSSGSGSDSGGSDGDRLLPDLFTSAEWADLGDRFGLTVRQLEIARWTCRGCTKEQVARRIRISVETVRMHMRELFKRLNIHDRVGVPVRLILAHRRTANHRSAEPESKKHTR